MTLPDSSRLSSEQLSALAHSLGQHKQGELSDEALKDQYSAIISFPRRSIADTVFGIERLLRGDEWQKVAKIVHPFSAICHNKMSEIVTWLNNGGPYLCSSCQKPMHTVKKWFTSANKLLNIAECYVKVHQQTLCGICRQVVSLDQCKNHFMACFEQNVRMLAILV
jgi:hypothetical protein